MWAIYTYYDTTQTMEIDIQPIRETRTFLDNNWLKRVRKLAVRSLHSCFLLLHNLIHVGIFKIDVPRYKLRLAVIIMHNMNTIIVPIIPL